MDYKWKDKAYSAVSAQIVGETIAVVIKDNDGVLIPATLVRAARPKRSPIHDCFEWDDKKAAGKYRETQASYLIRSVEIIQVVNEDTEPIIIRAFVSIGDDGDRYYTTIQSAMEDPETYEELLERARFDYKVLAQKYKDLIEFRKINTAISKI